jgi:hypothetical protein
MREFIRLIAEGVVRVEPLVDVEIAVDRAPEAYAALRGNEPPLAAVLTYDREVELPSPSAPERTEAPAASPDGTVVVAVVGAGSFLKGMHLPNLKQDARATIKWVVSRRGTTADEIARSLPDATRSF